MKKFLVTLCGLAIISSISAHAFAQEANFPHKFSPEMKARMEQSRAEFQKRLNLTPEQKEQMKAIHQASRAKIMPLVQNLKAEREKLEQLKQNNAIQADIQAQREKMKQLRNQIGEIRKSNFAQVQAILTPDQQKEFNKMHEEHKKQIKFNQENSGN